MPELIDTHVHLDDPRLLGDIDGVLDYARSVGVKKMINIGHDMESSRATLEIAKKYPGIRGTVGIHPHSAKDMTRRDLDELKELADQAEIVGIGEIGLDYYYQHSSREHQKEAFILQLELAQELKLPVVIHQRDAVQDTLELLAQYSPLSQGGVMHCFSSSVEVMRTCIDYNLHIGLGGPVTFVNAKKAKEVAVEVPLDRLILETDCPYLAPHPHRGKTNQPGYLLLIAAEISRLRSVSMDSLCSACTTNSIKLFNL